jgi:hypothetical protein
VNDTRFTWSRQQESPTAIEAAIKRRKEKTKPPTPPLYQREKITTTTTTREKPFELRCQDGQARVNEIKFSRWKSTCVLYFKILFSRPNRFATNNGNTFPDELPQASMIVLTLLLLLIFKKKQRRKENKSITSSPHSEDHT